MKQKMYNGLPLYGADVISDESGMEVISLVDDPAIQIPFMTFKGQSEFKFNISDEDKRLVYGPVMLADTPIYRNQNNMEFYITYSKDSIIHMVEKYFKNNNQNNVDTDHNFELEDGVTLRQMFIKDSSRGIVPEGFGDITDGSLFAEFHIENDDLWDKVKQGEFKGFSLAGIFDISPIMEMNKQIKNKGKMSKFERIKGMLKSMLDAVEFGTVSTDKGILSYDGDDEIEVGDYVQIYDPETETYKDAEDGEYKDDSQKTYVIENKQVKEIREEKDEETTEEETVVDTEFSKIRAKFEESYDEKYKKIAKALENQGIVDFYIYEAGDEYVVINVWNYGDEKYWKYSISWDADGNVILGEGVEVKHTFVPVEEPKVEEVVKEDVTVDETTTETTETTETQEFEDQEVENPDGSKEDDNTAIEEVRKEVNELYDLVDKLTKRVDELESKPAAAPASEELRRQSASFSTGDKRINRLNSILNA